MKITDAMNPYLLAAKLGGAAIVAALLLSLVASWVSRGQEIDRLKDWQNQVAVAATDAIVEPNAKGIRKPLPLNEVPHTITILGMNMRTSLMTMRSMTADTEAARQRAADADKALASATMVFEQRFTSAEKRIAALDNRKPAADPATQCLNVAADTKAVWEGWK